MLANDRSIVTKKTDKASCVVVWNREDYIAEAGKQLSDKNVYRDVNFKSKILEDLAKTRLCPSIPHEAGLKTLIELLEWRKNKKISANDLLKIAAFVLKNNYFELNGEVKHQISGTAIGKKFAPTYASFFMDEIETDFLDTQEFQSLVWF